MSIELTITISDEEKRKLTREFLVYEPVTLVENDPIIEKCVKEILEEFKGEPDDIKIRAVMILR
jgi:hypothetical protein